MPSDMPSRITACGKGRFSCPAPPPFLPAKNAAGVDERLAKGDGLLIVTDLARHDGNTARDLHNGYGLSRHVRYVRHIIAALVRATGPGLHGALNVRMSGFAVDMCLLVGGR